MKNIFKCTKCKGQKVRTRTQGMVCMNCKPPRTGRVEKKGDREKLEKVLKELDVAFELGFLIEKARLHAGFTQDKLAKKMKTKQSSIARAERGIQEVSVSFLQKVAKAVDTTLILPKFGFELASYEHAKKIAGLMPKTTSSTATMTVTNDSWSIIKPKKVNKKK